MPVSISPFFSLLFVSYIGSTNFNRIEILLSFVAETAPPPLVEDIHDWVSRVLPYIAGIREWPAFFKKFGRAPSVTGEFKCLNLYCRGPLVACFSLFYGD